MHMTAITFEQWATIHEELTSFNQAIEGKLLVSVGSHPRHGDITLVEAAIDWELTYTLLSEKPLAAKALAATVIPFPSIRCL